MKKAVIKTLGALKRRDRANWRDASYAYMKRGMIALVLVLTTLSTAGVLPVFSQVAVAAQPTGQLSPLGTPPQPTKQDKKTTGKAASKGQPRSGGVSTFSACGVCYFYAGAIRNPGGGATANAISVNMGVYKPTKAAADYHSLAEIAMQKDINSKMNAVEVGWTVDPSVNGGSSDPHLFVFRWVNGVPGTYNGSGWVDYAPTTTNAGANLSAHIGTQKWTGITHSGGNWWVAYNGQWIGYYPDSVWTSAGVVGFTNSTYQQVFGEIAASNTNTTSDMGKGTLAAVGPPAVGARMGSLNITPTGGTNGLATYTGSFATTPAKWSYAALSGSTFNYGGPGW